MKRYLFLLGLLALISSGCEKDEFVNPSAAREEEVYTNPDALIAVSNGLQARWTTGGALSPLYNITALGGLSTRELFILNVGNIEEFNVSVGGGNVTNLNGVVSNLWGQALLVRSNADKILANAGNIGEPGTRNGVEAYASIFRALALGTLAQYFEQVPLPTQNNAPFTPRVQVLQSAVAQLETAAAQLAATPASADFNSKIVPGIDLTNTIQALIARYSLLAGDYDKALAAAGRVNQTSRSVFNFDENSRNPLSEAAFGNRNVFEPTDNNLGLPAALAPEAGDRRVPFYVRLSPMPTQNRGLGFYTASAAPIPVYLPGEMLLIRAEAYARKSDLANAVLELNRVRTSTAAATLNTNNLPLTPPGAGLAPYAGPLTQDAVLLDIYRQRQVELAFQGFRLEDNRRFNRPGPGPLNVVPNERNRNFYPYPRTERDNNTATPDDPAI